MSGLITPDVDAGLRHFLLFLPGAIYLLLAGLAPTKIAEVGQGKGLISVQYLIIWSSLGGCLQMWTYDALSVFPHIMRSITAVLFGFLTAPIVIYRIQQAVIGSVDQRIPSR